MLEILLLMLCSIMLYIAVILSFVCYALYRILNTFLSPRHMYNKVAREAVTLHRKDMKHVPIAKYTAAKVATFVALRYIGKKF